VQRLAWRGQGQNPPDRSARYTRHVSILGFNAQAQGREEAQGNHFFALLCELCGSANFASQR
jgi:hypothetical protein